MRSQALLALGVMAAVLGFAQPAAAQYYDDRRTCEQERNDRTMAGVLLGAVAGGVLGNNVASTGNQGDGTILGAILGGAAGGAIARGRNDCDDYYGEGSYDPYDEGYAEPPHADPYYEGGYDDEGLLGGDDYGYRGDPRYADSGQCRWGTMEYYDRNGRRRGTEQVWMCQGRDGVWRPQE